MKIAVLSGKGGAGKTFVSVNLAATQSDATYIDCDVEEPNGHLFFKTETLKEYDVYKLLPVFDAAKCTGCRKCVDACRFHALVYIKNHPKLFQDICHSCGLCSFVCSATAISEKKKSIGHVEFGRYRNINIFTGIVNEGEASGVKVIEKAIELGMDEASPLTVIDCPPGSGCSVMDSIKDSDYCIVVVEATVFGFHNFKMVYELATIMNKPIGIIINKEEDRFQPIYDFCAENNIPVLLTIPFSKNLAQMISEGEIAVENDEYYREAFCSVIEKIGANKL